ncbi:MAG: hypothetical protein SRB1_02507 [Desulfobacteraceae bacterium Eth-SRB1]|nr:MAG: hypothetical protein SRB1_02507 [Desulfobacteraceae bacterium Eth-SRB1]
MHKYFIIVLNIACFMCCAFLITSCDNQAESPQKPVVISKKIVAAKSSGRKPEEQKKAETPKPVAKKQVSKHETKQPEKITPLKPESKKEAVTAVLYNPEGKIDPFAPLFREEKLVLGDEETMKTGKAGICIPHTPLQKVDLSQLKLVGIIRASSGNKAMVEEASGRGYVIEKGIFIGTNCGRVGWILKDRIIVDEPLLPVDDIDKGKIYDVDGKSFFITEIDGKRFINIDGKQFEAKINKINGTAYYIDPQELKLQKPSGE